MFTDANEIRSAILGTEPSAFVSHHIFDRIPHAFGGDLAQWVDYKLRLAKLLQVDPHEIVLTGSAAVGFSLNPDKGFASFHEGSDFDVAIVSGYHFDTAWRYLRQARVSWLSLPRDAQDAIRQHRRSYVFTGTIAANWFLHVLPFGGVWQSALDEMATVPPSEGRDIKLRIYKDYDCLRFYHSNNLRRIKENLLTEDIEINEFPILEDDGATSDSDQDVT